MEFPTLGRNCEKLDCNKLDFLPIKCNFCKKYFCSEHALPEYHSCTEYTAECRNPSGKCKCKVEGKREGKGCLDLLTCVL